MKPISAPFFFIAFWATLSLVNLAIAFDVRGGGHHNLLFTTFREAEDLCANVTCRAGRECRVLSAGIADCVCMASCPNKGRPICGSDGLLYKSHCDLHREACLKGIHIRPKFHDHSCHEDPLEKLKHELEQSMETAKKEEMNHIKVPRACRQNYRDRMREYLISWMSLTATHQPWYQQGMTEEAVVKKHFAMSDSNRDNQLDSREWIGYMREEVPTYKRDKKSRMLRKLCIEALIEEGDTNKDWRLGLEEFAHLMDKNYMPSYKYCLRDHKYYEDGTRTKVDCNGCICACGKWVCTSSPCSSTPVNGGKDATKDVSTEDTEHSLYEDMDNQID